jgi:hypothetical protein
LVTFLGTLKQQGKSLEQIEVLKAWDKRHLLRPVKSYEKPFQVEFNLEDDFMACITEQVGPLFSCTPIRFVGAPRARTKAVAMFLPETFEGDRPDFEEVTVFRWDLPWIGLSWSLRQDVVLSARIIRATVDSVNGAHQ